MENQFIAWSDWEYNEQFPYNEIKRSQAMLSEAMLFEKQERLKIEANERRAESEEMIERKKREFELDENERRTRMFTTLHQCWVGQICCPFAELMTRYSSKASMKLEDDSFLLTHSRDS